MPQYEFRCDDCNAVTSVFTRSMKDTIHALCSKCNSTNLTRIISKVTFRSSGVVPPLGLEGTDIEDHLQEMGFDVPPRMKEQLDDLRGD